MDRPLMEMQAAAPVGKPGRSRRTAILRTMSVVVVLAAWQLMSSANDRYGFYNAMLIPSPWEILRSLAAMAGTGQLERDIAASLSRVVQGFVIAGIVGVAMGVAVATWPVFENIAEPLIEVLRPIPPLAFLPMMVLWFGIGEGSKIAFIGYAAFFPVFTTTVEGIKYVDPVLVRAASSLGASRWQLFRFVVLPAATPSIVTGLRLGFALSFFVIVAAEFIAADSGLGFLINDSRTFFAVSQMLAGAVVIGVIGLLFNVLLRLLEARLLRWRQAMRS